MDIDEAINTRFLHSDSLTWKWNMVPWKTTFLYEQVFFHFHVSESECIHPVRCFQCSSTQSLRHSVEIPPCAQRCRSQAHKRSAVERASIRKDDAVRFGQDGGGKSSTKHQENRKEFGLDHPGSFCVFCTTKGSTYLS